jgi:hypothetical protein
MDKANSNRSTEKLLKQIIAKVKQNGKVIDEITRQAAEIRKKRKLILLEYSRNN